MIKIPVTPCPPEEFSGRYNEREILKETFKETLDDRCRGKVLMISGASGSGKSSLLDWVEYEMQKKGDRPEIPAVKGKFSETPGTVLDCYKNILKDIQKYTKLGWFKGIVQNKSVQIILTTFLKIVEEYTTPVDPVGIAARAGGKSIEKKTPSNPTGHNQVLTAFLEIFRKLSLEFSQEEDQYLVILLDDAQWSSDIDFLLLKDLIKKIPPRIVLILTYRLEKDTTDKHSKLLIELNRYIDREIRLGKMDSEDIQELSKRRCYQSIDEETAGFLSYKIGDPLCLIACLNLLNKMGLPVNIANVRNNMHSAIKDPVGVIYRCLDDTQIKWANYFCVLNEPMPLSIMACMLNYSAGEVFSLQDDLDKSYVFSKIEKGRYEFAHPSLREYRRDQLPDEDRREFHRIAADCFKNRIDKISYEMYALISLAGHAFYAEDYQTAFDLNFELGNSFYDNFLYSSALEFMTRAKISAEKMGDYNSLAAGYHHLGKILYKLYRYTEALENYENSLSISIKLGDRSIEAQTLHQIGKVYQGQFLYSEALKNYEKSLLIKKDLGDRFGEAKTFHQIGMLYQEQSLYGKALENYENSLSIEKELGNRSGEAKSLHQIGMVYQEQSLYDEALMKYNQSLSVEKELGNRYGEASTLHQIGMVYQEQSLYDEALEKYDQSLSIEKELGDRSGEAQTLHQVGRVLQKQSLYDEALEKYDQSLSIEKELGNRYGEASTLHQIGMVYQEQSLYDEALEKYDQSLSIEKELGDRSGEAKTLYQIKRIKNLKEKRTW